MGGAIFTLRGETEAEVRRKLEARLQEANHIGLYEEGHSPVEWDENTREWVAYVAVHS